MRGEDETIRVCSDHWRESDEVIIESMHKYFKDNEPRIIDTKE